VCDLDGAIVVPVADADEDVTVLQEQATVWVVELVVTVAVDPCGAILADDLPGR